MEVYCTKCGKNFYLNGEGQTPDNTPHKDCGGKLIEPELTHGNILDLCIITNNTEKPGFFIDVALYNSMVDLKKKDPIEFNLKMAQFHEIAEKERKRRWDSNPLNQKAKCPHCKSTNIKKIGVTGRMLSVGFFGLASKKIGKQWHCNNCGSDF